MKTRNIILLLAIITTYFINSLYAQQTTLFRINCGGPDIANDGNGNEWLADQFFTGGQASNLCTYYQNNIKSSDTTFKPASAPLYCADRVTTTTLSYAFNIPTNWVNATYTVNLHFAETWEPYFAMGKRVFQISINGKTVETKFDIFREAGGFVTVTKSYTGITPSTTSMITILLTSVIAEAKINAIDIVRVGGNTAPIDPNSNPVDPPYGSEQAVYRINCGGPAFTDKLGRQWQADQYYDAGTTTDHFTGIVPAINATGGDITIYMDERYSANTFSYTLPVTNGDYRVRLHWSENYAGLFSLYDDNNPTKGLYGKGLRQFSVSCNNQMIFPIIDVFGTVGPYAELTQEFDTTVTSGNIVLTFGKIIESPMIFGIEVIAKNNIVPDQYLPAGRANGLASVYYNYVGYPQDPLMEFPPMDRKPTFGQVITYIFNTPQQPGLFLLSPFSVQLVAIFNGYLRIPVSGTYTLAIESNDGSLLYLDGNEIINNDGNHGHIKKDWTGYLDAGYHPIGINYFQGEFNTCLRMYWTRPGLPEDIINEKYYSYDTQGSYILPVIHKLAPANGAVGSTITIDGYGFNLPGLQVSFGQTAATKVTVVNSGAIQVVVPNNNLPAGAAVSVTVTTSTGTSNSVQFQYA